MIILLTWAGILAWVQSFDFTKLSSKEMVSYHLITSIVLTIGAQVFFGHLRLPIFLGNFALHLFFPIMGSFFYLILIIALAFSSRMELLADFHEEDAALAVQGQKKVVTNYGESIQKTLQVEPIVEVIRSNSSAEIKRGAIETLSKIANPQSIALLKECLSDDNSEVRFYASSGLSRVEERLNEKIISGKNHLKHQKDVHPHVLAKDHLQLAKAYDEFIYLAIQDEASLEYYANKAIEHYEYALELDPKNEDIIQVLIRACTRKGEHQRAQKLREQLKEESKGDDSVSSPMYQAEAQFKDGDYQQCLTSLRSVDSKGYDAIDNVLELWNKTASISQEENVTLIEQQQREKNNV